MGPGHPAARPQGLEPMVPRNPLGDIHVAPPADHPGGQLPPWRGPLLACPSRGNDAARRCTGAARVAGALHPMPRPVRAHRRVQLPGRGRGFPQHHPAGLLQGAWQGQLLSFALFLLRHLLLWSCCRRSSTSAIDGVNDRVDMGCRVNEQNYVRAWNATQCGSARRSRASELGLEWWAVDWTTVQWKRAAGSMLMVK